MANRKSERLLNLLIMLLVQRRYVPKSRIREILYPDQGEEAFERMFDRDKEELRSLGVPVETGTLDAYFEDEVGYRIRPDQLALPEISLDADEAAVVGLAGKVWQHATLADATAEALRKLAAAKVPVDVAALDIVEPHIGADEPTFDVFWAATQERREVVFDYRRPGAPEARTRHLQPWGVVRYSGRWYAVGFDTDRGEERVFRLSRIQGPARLVGEPGSYEIPEGTDIRAVATRLVPAPATEPVAVLVRAGTGHGLRRMADAVEADVPGPDDRTAWDRVRLTASPRVVADEILPYGADAYVESPDSLRADVRGRLTTLLRTLQTTGGQ
ncbi:helix-turn-helix transcriptional regulator [Nocardioides campestrisoli]|uniref:helix-turn-helix transcriptional regulator n=1 Tax=Nocardioides campestrisoli TaxID=2736757 RepID=UPI0015E63E87|nr:WYL domain-containing protein [Nocardioides campestrisoli]